MAQNGAHNRLDRPVDPGTDHVLGPPDAPVTLVEYGSYACPYCRIANERIAEIRDRLGDRLRYVFRHRPVIGSELARRAAELAERTDGPTQFWNAHVELMTRSAALTEDDLRAVAQALDLAPESEDEAARRARDRVAADEESARASGVAITPTFFINGRRYDGPWDASSFLDTIEGRLGHRMHTAALDFASWGPSAGVLLLLAAVIAVIVTNGPLGLGPGGALADRGQARRLFLASTCRRRRARRHRLHHVAVHRRPGLSRAGGLRSGEDRGICGVGRRGGDRRRDPVGGAAGTIIAAARARPSHAIRLLGTQA